MKNCMRTLIALLLVGGVGLSSKAEQTAQKPSTEQRSKMASAHEQMAACLRSDKKLDDCHDEMRKTCADMDVSCSMMGPRGMRKMMNWKEKEEKK